MIFGETGNWEKCKFGKIKILKTGKLEIGNLEKWKFGKRGIWIKGNLEK